MAASPKPGVVPTKETHIAGFTLLAIPILLKYALHVPPRPTTSSVCGAAGRRRAYGLGTPEELFKRQFGSDLLAGISTLTAIALREYLVATIVVLMLSGGEALEEYATAKAPSDIGCAGAAHAKRGTSQRSERISPTCS